MMKKKGFIVPLGTKHFLRGGSGAHVPKNKKWESRLLCRKSKSQSLSLEG